MEGRRAHTQERLRRRPPHDLIRQAWASALATQQSPGDLNAGAVQAPPTRNRQGLSSQGVLLCSRLIYTLEGFQLGRDMMGFAF